jgi:hypothetical protein
MPQCPGSVSEGGFVNERYPVSLSRPVSFAA